MLIVESVSRRWCRSSSCLSERSLLRGRHEIVFAADTEYTRVNFLLVEATLKTRLRCTEVAVHF